MLRRFAAMAAVLLVVLPVGGVSHTARAASLPGAVYARWQAVVPTLEGAVVPAALAAAVVCASCLAARLLRKRGQSRMGLRVTHGEGKCS